MEKVEVGNTRIKDYVKEEPKEGKKIDENRRLCNKKNGDQVQQQVTEDGKEYFHWKGLPPLLMNLQVGDKGPKNGREEDGEKTAWRVGEESDKRTVVEGEPLARNPLQEEEGERESGLHKEEEET
ncbi:hypothetical protein Csa_010816 [Cucumis sativus]|uniref:Uncharacterized protein n=1 Tax=Cucumis sativus TaxID=3659 RepID=A0A0A0LBF8_CUCSA|nr:hypothetical protein Csa_010816 [Cucumis sativus]